MCKDWRSICREWRIWIRPLLIVSYILFAIIVVPILIVNSVKDGFSRKDQVILIGGLLVLSAVPISIWHIIQHIIHFTKPVLQKHIIRILWMVPIYALNSWLSLIFPKQSIYMDSIRECYEAYVIYNFMVFLLNYLNLGMDLEATLEHKPQVKHFFPLCCMTPWPMGREFIHNCKHGILQYTVVRPTTTLIAFICELSGVYGEGVFKFNVAFPYILFINNLTQFVAMYCLVLFYRANKEDLKPMRPLPKFFCIKAVVFFSFFQGVIIYFLVYFEVIKNIFGFDVDTNDIVGLSSLLQNFLICIEMFIAAIAHVYSFPHKPFHINVPEYWNNPNVNRNWFDAFVAMWDISDVQNDVSEHLGVVGNTLTRPFRGNTHQYHPVPSGYSNEAQYLIDGECYQSSISSLVTGNKEQSFNSNINRTKNRYGAIDTAAATSGRGSQSHITGINISQREEPQNKHHYGAAPNTSANFFRRRSNDDLGSSSTNPTTSSNSINITGNVKKSDSRSSDWLSTPTDELLGIDVRGVERDKISFLNDPKI